MSRGQRGSPEPPGGSGHTYEERQLANGVRIVHAPHPGGVAALYLWFDAGTIDETPEEAGAAHLLEHMLFKGTARRGVGVCAAEIEAYGGDLNAYTTWDQTVLHATVLAEHWEAALDVLVDMAFDSLVDPEELARERPVVLEEIRGYADDPESVLDDRVTERLFPDNGYGKPVLGTLESVAAMSRETLVGFWKRHYTAGRCVLGVAGPMDVDALTRAVERTMGALPRGAVRPALADSAAPEPGLEHLEEDFDTPLVSIAWRTATDGHPDAAVLELVANALGSGRAALLPRVLRTERRMVAEVWASTHTRRGGGSLEIGIVPLPGRTAEAIRAALELVEDAAAGRIAAPEVERARIHALAELDHGEETVDAVAHDLAWFLSRTGTPANRAAWRAQLSAVRAGDVQRVLAGLGEPVVTVLDPGGSPRIPSAVLAGEIRQIPDVPLHFSGAEDGWAAQGPLACIYLGRPGGRLLEPAERAGIVGMWSSLLTTGAGDRSSVALAADLDALSAGISAVGGRNTLGVQLHVPVANLRPALEILAEVVLQPRFDRSERDRLADETRFDLDTLLDRPDEVLNRRTWAHAFPDHPWGRNLDRTRLARLTSRATRHFHETHFTRAGMHVGIAGAVRPDAAARALQPLLAALPEGTLPERPAPPPVPEPHTTRTRAGSEQALVSIALRTPPMGSDSDVPLRMASALLSAQSGRLFMALRERESLAYGVWSRFVEGRDGGLLILGIAADPARRIAARDGLLRELELLGRDGPTDDELTRTRAMMHGQFAAGQQRASSRALHLGLSGIYGRSPHMDAARAELDAVDAAAIRSALQALPDPVIVHVDPR